VGLVIHVADQRSWDVSERGLAFTPGQRFRRSWRLRKRVENLQAVHDAKTFPEL
jgi:hypothetical protein